MQGEALDLGESLGTIEDAILPHLSRLIDGLLESAMLARPGMDGDQYATGLRFTAVQLDALGRLLASVASAASTAEPAPAPQPVAAPRRMSA